MQSSIMWNHVIRFFLSCSLVFHPVIFVHATVGAADQDMSDEGEEKPLETDHAVLTAHEFNKTVESLSDHVFEERSPNAYYQNHLLDVYSLIHQQVESSHNFHSVNHKKILVEVLNSKGQVQSVFSSQSVKEIPLEDLKSIYNTSNWKASQEKQYTFQIRYQDQVIHTFANHVQWMSFLGPYLVFAEPGQFYEGGRGFISFIDLRYFESALGKTALPIFRIPMSAVSGVLSHDQAKEVFLQTHGMEIDQKQDALVIKKSNETEYQLTMDQLNYLSRMQQISFNTMVSLVSVDRYESDFYPFLQSMITEFQKSAEKESRRQFSKSDWDESHKQLIELLTKEIQQRGDIGSSKDLTGHYGHLKQTQMELEQLNRAAEQFSGEGVSMPFYKKFTDHLDQDQKFQEMLSQTASEKFRTKKLLERLKGLYLYLTKPQPLGAPKNSGSIGHVSWCYQCRKKI